MGFFQVLELIPPPTAKVNKKIEIQKKTPMGSPRQQQLPQQQRRNGNGSGATNISNGNASAGNAPRRKIGVFGSPKFSPIVEEQNLRAEALNPNNGTSGQQQPRKNSRSSPSQGSGSSSAESSISAWMNRRISSGQLEQARSGSSSYFYDSSAW